MPRSSGHLKEVEALRTYAKRLARESVPLRTRMRIDERTYVVDGCVCVVLIIYKTVCERIKRAVSVQ